MNDDSVCQTFFIQERRHDLVEKFFQIQTDDCVIFG